MLNFLKKTFFKKKPEDQNYKPKLKSFNFAFSLFINYHLDKNKLYANFPEEQKKKLTKAFNDGLAALKKINPASSAANKKAGELKINNMLRILVKYNPNNIVDINKIKKNK